MMKDQKKDSLTIAQSLYKKCSYREALKICETLYITRPSDTNNLILLGAIHFQLRNLSESIFYSQQCLRVDETCAEAYVTIGNCMKEMGELESAMSFFHKAIRFQPRFPDAYNNLGCAFFKLGKFNEAIETLSVAISLDETHCDAICNLASVYKVMGRLNDAKNEYLRAIQIHPQCAIGWSNLGGIFNENRDFEQALKCYEHALTIIPDFADAHSNMGNAMYNLGKKMHDDTFIQKSIATFQKASELRPDFALASGNSALVHIYNKERSNIPGAEKTLRKASLQDPGFFDSLNNLSALYFEQGRIDECIKLCLRVLRKKPDHYCAYHNLANALREKGLLAASAYAFDTAISLNNKLINSKCGFAALMVANGSVERSMDLLCEAKEVADNDKDDAAVIHHNIGVAHAIMMKNDKAEKTFNHVKLSNWENQATTHYNLSVIHQRNGNLDKSITCLERSLAVNGPNIKVAAMRFKEFLEAVVCNWSNNQSGWQQIAQHETTTMSMSKNRSFNQKKHQSRSSTKTKVRIGYVFDVTSASGLLKIPDMHDSSKFDVFQYSIHMHEKFGIAEKILNDEIQILVLLDQSSLSTFDDILVHRLAPIQISFNSLMTNGVDYVVKDSPHSSISEKIMHVPGMFISNELQSIADEQKKIENSDDLRGKYGICEDSFVYASFAQPYKIDEATFKLWMNILQKTCRSSILLLIRHNDYMEANLKQEAEKNGVNPERIKFIEHIDSKEHFERYSLVDVFLDTVIYKSKDSFCEALLLGVPAICYQGDSSESCILNYVGLEEQIVSSLAEYETLAIALQFDEEKFISIIRKLDHRRYSEEGIFNPQAHSKWIASYEEALLSIPP